MQYQRYRGANERQYRHHRYAKDILYLYIDENHNILEDKNFHNARNNDNNLLHYYIMGLVHQRGFDTINYVNTPFPTRNRKYYIFVDHFSLNNRTNLHRSQRQKIQ